MNQKATSRKITQELEKLQRSIKIKLERFYKQKIKGSQLPPETLRQKFGQQLDNEIRNTVQSSWFYSNQIMQETISEKNPDFKIQITTKDIANIESTTNKMSDQFWTTSSKLWIRENEFKVNNKSQLVQLSEFDIPAAMVGMSLLFTYYAFNQAMVSKRDETGLGIKLKFVTRENCIDTAICIPLNGRVFGPGDIPIIPIVDTHKHCKCRLIPTLS